MSEHETLIELLRAARIGNQNDHRVAVHLIGWMAAFGMWTLPQQKLAAQLIARWTDPENAKRLNLARFKARSRGF